MEKFKWKNGLKITRMLKSAGQAGTGAGFQKFIAGDIDFADASRPIKDEEKQKLQDKNIKYKEFKIAQDGVTVAVNKENDFVDELQTAIKSNLFWKS
ncbi:substrate-binding domain-containing protein [Staphylococcus aureus]